MGRRRERKDASGKTFQESLPRDQWTALIPNSHPGYISWDQFESNQDLLAANAPPTIAPPVLLEKVRRCYRARRWLT